MLNYTNRNDLRQHVGPDQHNLLLQEIPGEQRPVFDEEYFTQLVAMTGSSVISSEVSSRILD